MTFKVVTKCSKNGSLARFSALEVTYKDNTICLEGPTVLLYTRQGAVPFLTNDLLKNLPQKPVIAFGSMNVLVERKAVFEAFKQGVTEFSRLNMPLALFQNDPIDDCQTSVYSGGSVSVWATGGRRQVSIDEYASFTELSRCQIVQSPVDNETKKSERESLSRKRTQKAVLRCEKLMESFLKVQPKNVLTLASIGGGNLVEARLQCSKLLDLSSSIGVALDGFHFSDSNTEAVFPVLKETIDGLPDTMLRFLNTAYQPGDIVRAVAAGVDMFDGSLAYRLSRSGIAWLYKDDVPLQSLHFPNDDQFYKDDLSFNSPLQKDCTCHACANYNKAYVNHLHSVQEMLAQILLMLHNSHQLYSFMQDLRNSIKNDNFQSFFDTHKDDYFSAEQLKIDLSGEQPPLKRKNDKAVANELE